MVTAAGACDLCWALRTGQASAPEVLTACLAWGPAAAEPVVDKALIAGPILGHFIAMERRPPCEFRARSEGTGILRRKGQWLAIDSANFSILTLNRKETKICGGRARRGGEEWCG